MLEQNHVKKASEIAMTAMAFSAAKLALWCLHDISTSKFKISFDRKIVWFTTHTPFSILNGIPGILVSICIYLCMSKKLNSYFSDVFCMASNFLNRYFVNVICICVYFFSNLSMVEIFFYLPAFYQFLKMSPQKFKL